MKLYLIGLPGSGKSFLGKQLADEMKLPFIDLDRIIEEETGSSIAWIFSEKGEEYFRNLEATALRRQSKTPGFVMASGGGTPCFHNNMEFMNETGVSVFIDTPLADILPRIDQQQANIRPLLADAQSVAAKLQTLLQKRRPVYEQAHITIDGSDTQIAAVIGKITSFKKHTPR